MRNWIIHWILSGVALLIVANVVTGIQVDGFRSALIAALVIGFVSATVGFFLKIILLPFIFLTLGLVLLPDQRALMLMLAFPACWFRDFASTDSSRQCSGRFC